MADQNELSIDDQIRDLGFDMDPIPEPPVSMQERLVNATKYNDDIKALDEEHLVRTTQTPPETSPKPQQPIEIPPTDPAEASKPSALDQAMTRTPNMSGTPGNSRPVGTKEEKTFNQNVLAGGVAKAVQEAGNAAMNAAGFAQDLIIKSNVHLADVKLWQHDYSARADFVNKVIDQTDDRPEAKVARNALGFIISFAGAGAALKTAGVGGSLAMNAVVTDAAVAFAGVDPKEERLSDLLKSTPGLIGPIFGLLSSQPGDSEIVSRSKNMIENAVLDVALLGTGKLAMGIIDTVGAYKATRQALKATRIAQGLDIADNAALSELKRTGKEPVLKAAPDPGKANSSYGTAVIDGKEVRFDRYTGLTDQDLEHARALLSVDDSKAFLAATDPAERAKILADSTNPQVKKFITDTRKNGVVPNIVALEQGAKMAKDPVKMQELKNIQMGDSINTTEAGALKITASQEVNDIFHFSDVVDNMKDGPAKIAAELEFQIRWEAMRSSESALGAGTSEGARVTQFASVDVSDHIDNLHSALDSPESLELARKIADAPDAQAARAAISFHIKTAQTVKDKAVRSLILKRALNVPDAALEVWFNSVLSGPITQTTNILGNMATVVSSIPETFLADVFEGASAGYNFEKGAVTSALNTAEGAVMGAKAGVNSSKLLIRGHIMGMQEALGTILLSIENDPNSKKFLARAVAKNGEKLLGKASSRAVSEANPEGLYSKMPDLDAIYSKSADTGLDLLFQANTRFIADALEPILGTKSSNILDKGLTAVPQAINVPITALQKMDVIFKTMNYRARQFRMAGQYGDSAESFMRIISNPTEAQEESMAYFAREQTFTKDMKDVFAGEKIDGVLSALKEFPIARTTVPFASVAANMNDFVLQRLPLINRWSPSIGKAYTDKNPQLIAMARAKVALGVATFMSAAGLGTSGILVGRGLSYQKQRALTLGDKGHQPYSIKVLGGYYSLDKLGSYGDILKIGIDAADMIGYVSGDNPEKGTYIASMAAMIAMDRLATPAFTESVPKYFDLIASITKGEATTESLGRFATSQAANLVPYANFLRQTGRAVDLKGLVTPGESASGDPRRIEMQGYNTTWEMFKAETCSTFRILGMTKDMPPNRNLWGDDVYYDTGFGPDIITPIRTMDVEDSFTQELERLSNASGMEGNDKIRGDTTLTLTMPPSSISLGYAGEKNPTSLTAQQYDRFVLLSAGLGRPKGEEIPSLRLQIKDILKQKLNDANKKTAIMKMVRLYRSDALEILKSTDQDLMEKKLDFQKARIDRQMRGVNDGSN